MSNIFQKNMLLVIANLKYNMYEILALKPKLLLVFDIQYIYYMTSWECQYHLLWERSVLIGVYNRV